MPRVVIEHADFKYPYIRVELEADDSGSIRMVADHLMVRLKDGIPERAWYEAVDETVLAIRKTVIPGQVYLLSLADSVEPDADTLNLIRSQTTPLLAMVEGIEPDYIVQAERTPNDSQFGLLWGLHNTVGPADISAPAAWDITVDASSVLVAVIDTGIDYTHPDLAANIWTNSGEIPGNEIDDDGNGFVDDVHGYDFYNDDGDPMDDHFHGTHCAGTIGATGDNGSGVTGVAWSANIMAVKFLNETGRGSTSDAIAAIHYAYGNGADITSNSWGGGGYSSVMFSTIEESGKIFVAAAGNYGSDTDAFAHYPSTYDLDTVISVAATDRNDRLASFSNYGADTVDLGAPGVSTYSTLPGERYGSLSGTSMATPHVSGACALLLALDPTLTPGQVKLHLLNSTDPIAALADKTVSGGRLNLDRLLRGDSSEAPLIDSPANDTAYLGLAYSYQITAEPQAVWYDANGLPEGLSLNRGSGVISGIPKAGGVFVVSLVAGNAKGIGSAELTLTVVVKPPRITSLLSASGQQGEFFLYETTADPVAQSFEATGLPAGLSITESSGIISGYPEEHGTFSVQLTATNTGGSDSVMLTLVIAPPAAPEIISPLAATGVVAQPFQYKIVTTNHPVAFSASGLPEGLVLNTGTGVISGTPSSVGVYPVVITAENSGGMATETLTITVNLPDAPVITGSLAAQGQVGISFAYTVTATNTPASFAAQGLPAGLSLNPSTGIITGTPTEAGSFPVLIGATNLGGTGSATLTLLVLPAKPIITSPLTVTATVNTAFSYQITQTPEADSYNATGLPEGLSVNGFTGLISGQVATIGTYPVTVSATNTGGIGSAKVNFNIVPHVPVFGGPLIFTYQAGEPIELQVAVDHSPTSYSVSGLPEGLALNSGTGRITGALVAMGEYSFELTASNLGGSTTASVTLNIVEGPTRITGFSPDTVDPHDTLTISGVGFEGATEVYFSDRNRILVPEENFTVISDNEIQVEVPELFMTHDFEYSWLVVNTPQGIAVAFPPDYVEVNDGYEAVSASKRYYLVRDGGALIGGKSSSRVVIEDGGAAQPDEGEVFFVGSGGFLDISRLSGCTVFHAEDAFILDETTISAASTPQMHVVSAVTVSILDRLLDVRRIPIITSPAEDSVAVGEFYSYDFETQYPESSLNFAANEMPAGLSFSSSSGSITGYPTTPGVYPINFEISNNEGTAYFTLTLTVTGDPVPVVTSAVKVEGDSTSHIEYTITVANGPATFSADGLPAGLSIAQDTGVISGIPTEGGIFNVTITATNSYGSTSRVVSFFIDASPLAVTAFAPTSMPMYSTLTIQGRGLEEVEKVYFISRRNQAVEGTDIAHISDTEMTVMVPSLRHASYDASPVIVCSSTRTAITLPESGEISRASRLKIVPSGVTAVTSSGGNNFYVESGGVVNFSGGGGGHLVFLEDGATVNTGGGGGGHLVFKSPNSIVLNRNATVVEVPSISANWLDQDMLNVRSVPVITSEDAKGNVGDVFAYWVELDWLYDTGRYYYADNLPPGVVIDVDEGTISGVPTQAGVYEVELAVVGYSEYTGTKTVTFTIEEAPLPVFTSADRVNATIGEAIDYQVTADNAPTAIRVTDLAPGLSDDGEGHITGQVDEAGAWLVSIEIDNAYGTISKKLFVAIDRPAPLVTTMPVSSFTGAPVLLQGENLDLISSSTFSDWRYWDNDGLITAQSKTELTLTTPELNMAHELGTVIALFGSGGTTVLVPDTWERVSGTVSSSAQNDYLVLDGGRIISGSTSGIIYAQRGSFVNVERAQVVFAENGSTIDVRGAGRCCVVHAPNAIVLHSSQATLIPVNDLSISEVRDFLKILPVPVINSPVAAKAYLDIPFYYNTTATNSPTAFNATGLPAGLSFNSASGAISGAPTETGTFKVKLFATNSYGTSSSRLSLWIGDPFDYWKKFAFADLNEGENDPMAADEADPDRDGKSNLLEYAESADPLTMNHANALGTDTQVRDGCIEYSFRRRKGKGQGDAVNGYAIEGIRYIVETSDDMVTWNTGPTYFMAVGYPQDNGDGTETVTVCLKQPLPQDGHVFLRVRVERVP